MRAVDSRRFHNNTVENAVLWLGGQGWQYKDWIGTFYPAGTQLKDMLSEYGSVFRSVEVDSSYYGAPTARTVDGWSARSPEGFRFSLKTPAEVTHERRFRDAEGVFAEFLDIARRLGPKLGVVLIQCPPDFDSAADNRAALFSFLRTQLPNDIAFALELRDPLWYRDDLFALARECRITLAVTEGAYADLRLAGAIVDELTKEPPADFAYVRWLGDRQLTNYARVQIERTGSLDVWERLIRKLRTRVRDIYGYVNNHYQGHSPATVREILARLGEPVPPETTSPRLL
jgi:uncharacterized protein YecE (DUF72 family)